MQQGRFEGRWPPRAYQPAIWSPLERVILQGDRWADEQWRQQSGRTPPSGFTPPDWSDDEWTQDDSWSRRTIPYASGRYHGVPWVSKGKGKGKGRGSGKGKGKGKGKNLTARIIIGPGAEQEWTMHSPTPRPRR